MNQKNKIEQIKKIPLLPLRGLIVFPYMVLHFDVGRKKSIEALEQAMIEEQLIFLTAQKDARKEEPSSDDIYEVGTICKIKQLLKLPGNNIRVLVEGINRSKLKNIIQKEPFFKAEVIEIQEYERDNNEEAEPELEALVRSAISQFEEYVGLSKKVSTEILVSVKSIEEPGRLADIISSHLNLTLTKKQQILESITPKERLEKICHIISREIEVLKMEKKINIRVKKQMERTQKEYYLREQLKAIQKELGDKDDITGETEEYKEKIAKADLPKEAEEKALKELNRLSKMPPSVAEAVVIRNYLDWILDLPWKKETNDRLDIEFAEKILDEDHYGLKKVKERILEYLAIRQLNQKLKGPILCLVGPPGVGKTSLAKSIARAIERKFIRISLGGVKDEAEIRGHRRTYVGSLPGRIIQAMKDAGSKNPVFLMDEIDKMSADFRGDPSSALLEVLDPEQNSTFSDHFLEIPYDLSKVMFITTANTVFSIPRPLLDRMELIHIPGYTEEEKVKIAEKHLIQKQLKEHGLDNNNLEISQGSIKKIIRNYTREAGVRSLERQIGSLCRKVAKRILKEKDKKYKINTKNINNYLGIPIYRYGEAEKKDDIGVATGMAWTESGGDILSIEVTIMKGKGKLTLTGKLGNVMQESAQAGLSFIRTKAKEYNIVEDFYEKKDVHIHIPEGAIPKDGPSAGITMATAMISALANVPISKSVAMSGEITLRGRVLPVGGIKQKILAAHRAGIKNLIIPDKNKRDLEDVPANIKRQLNFILVNNMDDVLESALVKGDKNEN